jgi:hypothetical protein
MLTFQFKGKKYRGASALDIVRVLESDAEDYPYRGQSVRRFLRWSLESLGNRLPPRDLDLSDRLEDDTLALSYLYLRDEYGAGKLTVVAENGSGDKTKILFSSGSSSSRSNCR